MYFITGVAGFIGFNLALKLLKQNKKVIGLDNLNNYYNVALKETRLNILKQYNNFIFKQIDVTNQADLENFYRQYNCPYIIHLAAQPGVRYSTINPYSYNKNNIDAQLIMLELVRHNQKNIKHFIFASSSSVYGANSKIPFNEDDKVMSPVSMYAATKLAKEHLAYSYYQMYKLPITGLRFFTVYGPFGRPDMAIFNFSERIFHNQAITLYGQGLLQRDFTYIDDIVMGITNLLDKPKDKNYQLYNLGNNKPIMVKEVVKLIEKNLNKPAIIEYQDKPIGDVEITYADITKASNELNFIPQVSIEEGIKKFIAWYQNYAHNKYNI